MKPILTPTEMYETERRFMAAAGMPSIELMERAALEFTGALEARAGGYIRYKLTCQ
jgi:NAD(P)H-hydrate repair Nnr-like enzyme with NAD(P)H-hydrate epimerase domain